MLRSEEVVEYDLESQTIPVKLKNKQTPGGYDYYIMVEIDGIQRDRYYNDSAKRVDIGAQGEIKKLKSFDGHQSFLLGMVLHHSNASYTEVGDPVDEALIQSWPSRIQEDLHAKAIKLCGLELKAAKAAAKND